MQVGDMMQRDVVTVDAMATFAEAAAVLRERRISSVVVQEEGRPAGILTERDFVNLVAERLDPAATAVGDRMARDLITIRPRSDIAEAARIMAERRIRHLPVVARDELVGIMSIRDLTSWAVDELTGGHELPDVERGSAALAAAVEIDRLA